MLAIAGDATFWLSRPGREIPAGLAQTIGMISVVVGALAGLSSLRRAR